MTTKRIKESEYFQHPAISRSDLLLIERSPRLFDAQREGDYTRPDSDAFRMGSLIEMRLFEPDLFDEKYALQSTSAIPPSSPQQKAFIQDIINGLDMHEAYSSSYSVKGKSDDAIAKAAYGLISDYGPYIEFCKELNGREVYDLKTEQMLLRILNNMQLSRSVQSVWNLPKITQLGIVGKLLGLEMRVLLDAVFLDEENEIIYSFDLKSTAKTLAEFHWSYKKYQYDVQQYMYTKLLERYVSEHLKKYANYEIKIIVMAVEKGGLNEVCVWEVPRDRFIKAESRFQQLAKRARWHMENHIWHMTREEHERTLPLLPMF